jgi:glycosyltransferase involved in cell wall biosynthesis
MKIGIDARMYSSGFTGIGRYTFELIRNLAKLDQENEFVIFLNSPEFENFRPPASNFRKVKVNASHYSLREQTAFLRILNKEKLDLVHFTHFNSPLLYRGKYVTTIHDLTLSFFPGKKMNDWLHRAAYNLVLKKGVKKAAKIVAVSANTKKDLIELLKTPGEKIEVVWNGVGREFTPTVSTELSRKQLEKDFDIKKSYLLYTGVWRDHKNILGMLEAVAQLARDTSFDGELIITGKANPVYAPEIFSKVKALGLEKTVVFTGLVSDEDLRKLYQNARVFVFPSFYEGFGLPPLEAMSCGIPVVASNSSSIPEVCGGAAEFFDPKNISEMSEKIWKVWNDESVRKRLIERGEKRVMDFSWREMGEETLNVYREVLGE